MQLSPLPPQRAAAPLIIPEDVPVYRLREAAYIEDTLFPEGSVIVLEDDPGPHMQPLNKVAYDKMVDYLTKLDELGKKVETQSGKRYVPVLPPFLAAYQTVTKKKVMRLDAPEIVPILGGKQKRGQSKVKNLESEQETTALGNSNERQQLNLSVGDRGLG